MVRRLARRRLPLPGGENAAHDNFVDLLGDRAGLGRGTCRPLERRPDRHAAESRRRHLRQTALESTDGSSRSAKNHNLTHESDDSRRKRPLPPNPATGGSMQKIDTRPTCSTLAPMTARRRSHLLVALCAAGASGCGGVIPGLLPTWAADTLGPADLELPRPASATRAATAVAPRSVENLIVPLGDPRGYGAEEEASAWVELELRDRGVRFGTDGTVASLLEYVRSRHGLIAPAQTRPGDVVFFDVSGRSRCGDHAGVVDQVDAGGRIAFRESRGGVVRLSYAHPGQPSLRRAVDGRVHQHLPAHPARGRSTAGTAPGRRLLCAVGRVAKPPARRVHARAGSGT